MDEPSSTAASASLAEPALVKLMEVARIPGLTLAEIRGGKIVGVEVEGVESIEAGEPVTRETLFEAASLSKPVFATIVLRMAERGELDLDRPLGELLANDRIDHDPRARAITARLVLSHRTGLPNWGGDRLELGFDPGDGFSYSGEGYVYLQQVVEGLTGLSLDELARREVFEPLGMSRSRFSWSRGEDGRLALAVPHDPAGRPRPKREPHEANAAASLHTTAAEYARFVLSWMGSEAPLLPTRMRRMALAPAVHMQGGETSRPKPPEVWQSIAWGLGWALQRPASAAELRTEGDAMDPAGGPALVWHWGDNGPFKAFVAFDPEAGDGVVYFANSANGLAIGRALVASVVGDMSPSFEWAGYEAHDAPGFSEQLAGLVATAERRWKDAIAAFGAALALDPGDEGMARRIDWLRDLERVEAEPVRLPVETLERYAGTYGPRQLWVEDGSLRYRRGGGHEYVLIPLSERFFALDGMADFRLEVIVDETGEPVKLVGHYVEGETDESSRD